ncbi:MAG TPA: CHASE3 domain-containing protein [Pyrinomonadaceae bacterium]|nr:CHASE3 domain-containing protein [Pyrinomonadaceae bacterium]
MGNAVISFRAANTLVQNNQRVLETQEAIKDIESLFSVIKDAETGQRGYLLTGNEEFLGPYNVALSRIEGLVIELRELKVDDPRQLERIPVIEEAVVTRLRTLALVIELYRSEGLVAVARSGYLGKGREQMDRIRVLVEEFENAEERRLETRVAESAASSRNSILTFIAANLAVLLLLVAVYFLLKRDLAARQKAEEELRAAHEQLEQRVLERTAELNSANTELERSNRELQDFAYVASHDLQEPLRKIQAFGDRLRSLQGPKFDERGLDYLNRMQSAAGRMHTLINDLLTFSRVTTKAQPFVQTDLRQVCEAVIDDLETLIQSTGGRVEIGQLPVIDADPLQMRQLFQNLIANALKFHRDGVEPVVIIKSEPSTERAHNGEGTPDRQMARITVEDNGIGFDEKYLDRIFTPFQRLHGRGQYEGTGIGLAVCRKIVERHGGSLTATSVPGKGSTFIATVPVAHDDEDAEI